MEATNALMTLVSLLFLCLLPLCVCRAYIHPLAKYPGPLIGRITDWYSVYHAWIGDRHTDIYKLHRKYGDVVRYGPNRICINSSVALHEIYGAKSNVQKSKLYGLFESFFLVASSGSIIDKVKHGSRRRIVGQAFTIPAVKSMEGLILANVRKCCHRLAEEGLNNESNILDNDWSPGRDMTDRVALLTIDIIGGLLFGQAWDFLAAERKKAFLETIPAGTKGFLMAGHMPAILNLRMDRVILRRTIDRARNFENTTKRQMEQRMAADLKDGAKQSDLFDKLLAARDNNTGASLSAKDLQAEAMTFMVAGSDTMATTMTATLFYLLHYPTTLDQLRNEVDSTFSSVEDIVMGPQLNSCIYLRACLDETLRLNPPVGGVLPREVLKGGATIDSNFYPAGTDVGTSLYALQRQERYFRNALSYEPQRWLENEGSCNEEKSASMAAAFAPFSLGPRGCPAKGMAYAEMMVTLARMVYSLDMRLESQPLKTSNSLNGSEPALFQTNDFFVSTHDGPVVQFRKRKRPE